MDKQQFIKILSYIILFLIIAGAYLFKFLKKYGKEIGMVGLIYWLFKKNKK